MPLIRVIQITAPESHRVLNTDNIRLMEKIGPERQWSDRRKLILGKNKIYTYLQELIDLAKANKLSLAVFKPTEILDVAVRAGAIIPH